VPLNVKAPVRTLQARRSRNAQFVAQYLTSVRDTDLVEALTSGRDGLFAQIDRRRVRDDRTISYSSAGPLPHPGRARRWLWL